MYFSSTGKYYGEILYLQNVITLTRHFPSLPPQMQEKKPKHWISFEGGKNLVLIPSCIYKWLINTNSPGVKTEAETGPGAFPGISKLLVRFREVWLG